MLWTRGKCVGFFFFFFWRWDGETITDLRQVSSLWISPPDTSCHNNPLKGASCILFQLLGKQTSITGVTSFNVLNIIYLSCVDTERDCAGVCTECKMLPGRQPQPPVFFLSPQLPALTPEDFLNVNNLNTSNFWIMPMSSTKVPKVWEAWELKKYRASMKSHEHRMKSKNSLLTV